MILILTLIMLIQDSSTVNKLIYDFSRDAKPTGWLIINDGVMGGLSRGHMSVDEDGNGLFWGHVSLANNGGFSLARLTLPTMDASEYSKIVLEVKGDSKRYQFRLKEKKGQMHSHVHFFETNGEWEKIEIPFEALRPTFRGRTLNMPKYAGDQIEEIGLLIGNKNEEDFQLRIRTISLQ